MSEFKPFASLVHSRFVEMSKNELYVTVDGDLLWEKYLQSFPAGTNPIYKTRTEHDCSCCKNFIRNIGTVVSVVNGKLQSVWGIKGAAYPFNEVAAALDALVLSMPITNLFRASEPSYGAEQTKQLLEDKSVINWNHFHGKVAAKHFTKQVDKARGDYRTTVQVFKRGLEELKPLAVSQVRDLIDSNAIYRGAEHLNAVLAFQKIQGQYLLLPAGSPERDTFVWTNAVGQAAHFRNTVIGTLVQDLNEGIDLEHAVRAFESKVAPTNYKRTTALITPGMVKAAMKTITELELEPALERRFANIGDVSVNNVLWVDNSVKTHMKGGVEGLLMSAVGTTSGRISSKPEEITIGDFMSNVVPKAQGMGLLVQGKYLSNLVSLTAPVHPDSGKLFKWNNDFGWSYNGNITDSIKEKVKNAGGNVTHAKLRVSLAWFNFDDLDIHIYEPDGNHIYYANKSGKQDVDMNAGGGHSREPVENVSWTTVRDGSYRVCVNQFSRRETTDVGFVIEIESGGNLSQLSYKSGVKDMVEVCTLTVKSGAIVKVDIAKGIEGGGISQEQWGIKTETFVKVQTLMHSPNYWDGNAVGNKHWIFMLEGCCNPEPTRGIYNEFLNPKLDEHRKVFEVLGDKTKCAVVDNQLSGMGFSSTRQDVITVQVQSSTSVQKTYNVQF